MIYILETINNMDDFCKSFILYNILSVMKKSLNILQIIGPILTMVALTISFIKLTLNPEEKKYLKGIKNSLIATVIMLMMPALINLTMSLLDDGTTISSCWKSIDNNSVIMDKN